MADGLPWVKRPLELCQSNSDISEAIKHALITKEAEEGKIYDFVVCLQPAIPLRNGKVIKNLVSQVIENDCKGGLTGVSVVPWLWSAKDGHAYNSWYPNPYPRSQEFVDNSFWQEINTVQVSERSVCIGGARWGLPLYILLLPSYAVLDIDHPEDLLRAQAVFYLLNEALMNEELNEGFIVKNIN